MTIDTTAIHDALAAYGWTAEYEPSAPDDEPARYTYGRTGGGRYYRGDPVLILHYGTMPLSGHPTLDLSVHGVAGTIASVDLATTPAAEVPVRVAQFARRNLIDVVAYASAALRCAATLPETPASLATSSVGDVFADAEATDDPDSGPLDDIDRCAGGAR